MVRLPIVSLALLLLAAPLAAQDAPPAAFAGSAFAEGALLDRPEALDAVGALVDASDRAAFDAFDPGGAGHFGLVEQVGDGHVATLRQSGAGNLAVLYQLGAHQTAAIEQVGVENILGLRLEGDGGTVQVQQIGDGNLYLFDVAADHLGHTVLQRGDDLQAIQTGNARLPFGIEQRGAGMRLIIEH